MTYEEQLKDQKWIERRKQIKNRDNNECQVCLSKKKLCVHHKKYIYGTLAWDYEDRYLITLCDNCHKLFHHKIKPPKVEAKAKNGFKYSENDIRHLMNAIPVEKKPKAQVGYNGTRTNIKKKKPKIKPNFQMWNR